MKNQFLDFAVLMLAVINGVMALWFAVNIVADPGFTTIPSRAAPKSAVGVAFCMFLWLALHAGVLIAVFMERDA